MIPAIPRLLMSARAAPATLGRLAAIPVWLLSSLSATGSEPGWADVGAIFEVRCVNCHSELGAAKGLRLDSYAAAIAGSEDGPVLLAGNVSESELVRRVRGESTPRMPFLSVPLPPEEIDLIVRWIEAGLPEDRK